MKGSRRWFFGTLAGVSLILFGFALVNFFMDPFSRRVAHEIDYDRWMANRDFNVPLWSVFSVGRLPIESMREAEVIVLGDSRATLLTKEGGEFRLRDIDGRKVLNLSIGGGSLRENISFYKAEERRAGGFPKLKTVVFTAPFNRICEGEKPDRIKESMPMEENSLLYYFSGYTLKRSLASIRAIGKSRDEIRRPLTQKDGEKALENWKLTYLGYDRDLAESRFSMLEEFGNELKAQQIGLIFYMPPGGGSGRVLMAELGLEAGFDDFLTTLAGIGKVENWADRREVGGEEFSYKVGDPIHHDKGVEILMEILTQ